MRKLLVVTNKEDTHADYVIRKFNEEGFGKQVIRLNTEDFISNTRVHFKQKVFEICLIDSDRKFNSKEIGCVLYRRPKAPIVPEEYAEEATDYIKNHISVVLHGLYACIPNHVLWINPRDKARISSNKLKQLQLAYQIGFKVPETIVTNDSRIAKKFFEQVDEICIKRLGTQDIVIHGELFPFFTTKISDEDISCHVNQIESCPTLFQQFINKIFDLRVVVIGEKIYAVEIHSQELASSTEDFRIVTPELMLHKPHDLPQNICDKIRIFMSYYNLVFSAFDFAVTHDGEYFFLENNPNGQWLWLELETDLKIVDGFFDTIHPYIS